MEKVSDIVQHIKGIYEESTGDSEAVTNFVAIGIAVVSFSISLFVIFKSRPGAKVLKSGEYTAASGKQVIHVDFMRQVGKPLDNGHIKLEHERFPAEVMVQRSQDMVSMLTQRRSLRFFSSDNVPEEVVNNCILAAGTAPSGAHCQPWKFCVVKTAELKAEIRRLVEHEEQINYDRRMRASWVKDVENLVTDLHENGAVKKPYLTTAPYIVVVMKENHGVDENGNRVEHYYVEQSVGLAVGMFLAALNNAGLATLTSTPMGAESGIRELLGRPKHEKVFLLMPVGYPDTEATVPYRDSNTLRKRLGDIATYH